MAHVSFEDIHKAYPNGYEAVQGIDLDIRDGELMVLVGPSGCGKSTLLRMVAGLETPTRGRIRIGDRDVTGVRPQDRDVAMVFQSYALYPHRTVRQNLAFALELRKLPKPSIDARIADVSRALGLEELLDRKPAQLSGGQRQRVALGRAIVREPQAFLFDEPLSNLDATLRVQTRAEIVRLHRRLRATMIYVTHDQEEAMTLGDRIAVLDRGRLQQCAPPMEVYRTPANAFVAGFVGSPRMNFLDGTAVCDEDGVAVSFDGPIGRTPNRPAALRIACAPAAVFDGTTGRPVPVTIGIRPEDVSIVANGEADLTANVDVVERLGPDMLVHLDMPGAEVRVLAGAEAPVREGEAVGLRFRRDRVHLFDRGTGARLVLE